MAVHPLTSITENGQSLGASRSAFPIARFSFAAHTLFGLENDHRSQAKQGVHGVAVAPHRLAACTAEPLALPSLRYLMVSVPHRRVADRLEADAPSSTPRHACIIRAHTLRGATGRLWVTFRRQASLPAATAAPQKPAATAGGRQANTGPFLRNGL